MPAKLKYELKIDVTQIDKTRLFKGEKGTYLTLCIFENDTTDKYGNIGFATQSMSKEQRESGMKSPILGNIKPIGGGAKPAQKQSENNDNDPF